MRKTKWILIVVMLLLAVIVSACGAKEANSPASSNNSNGDKNAVSNTTTGANAAEPTEAEELTITHKLGQATLKKNPEKVVVFDSGVLDTLDKLGVAIAAAPKSGLPKYLDKYMDDAYTNAGTVFEPDFEKLNALKPDVIFISGRASEAYDELNKIAPTIFMGVDTARYYDSFKENAKTLGQIFSKDAEVDAALENLDKEVVALKEKYEATGKKGLVVLTNAGKLSAYGKGSRFGLIHDVFGVTPSDQNIEVSTHGMSVTSEYIAEQNPDFLFVIDRSAVVQSEGAEAAEATIENDLVKNTNASKEGKIKYLNPDYWYLSGGGLISMEEMLQEVASVIN